MFFPRAKSKDTNLKVNLMSNIKHGTHLREECHHFKLLNNIMESVTVIPGPYARAGFTDKFSPKNMFYSDDRTLHILTNQATKQKHKMPAL